LKKDFISKEEYQILIERRNFIQKRFDDQAQKIRTLFIGNN